MDPTANLEELRGLVEEILEGESDPELTGDPFKGDYFRLAELFDALDKWITNGGFLPRDWQR